MIFIDVGVESGDSFLPSSHLEPFLLRSAKIRLFSDTTKFRVAIRRDFQQPLIPNFVNNTNSL